MFDADDRRILRHWQADPGQGVPELADATGLSAAQVTRRLDKLRASGVVAGIQAVIDWRALGYSVEVSLRVTLDKTNPRAFDEFMDAARSVPEVVEIQTFLGRVDVRLSVIARDLADYQRIYREEVMELPHLAEIEALMTVATVKADEALPL